MNIIGIDLGYGYTKAVAAGREVRFPSITGPAVRVQFNDTALRSNGKGVIYRLDEGPDDMRGSEFFCGEWAQLQSPFIDAPRARERTGTDHTGRLFVAALHQLGVPDGEASVVTGLPVQWYGDRLKVERQMLRTHHFYVNEQRRAVTISQVYIMPQPVGALFYSIMDGDGRLINTDLAKGRLAVIDIGMYTTDYTLVDHLRYIEKDSGSIDVGMGRVYDLVGAQLRDGYGLNLGLHQVDQAIREHHFRVNGQTLSIDDLAAPAVQDVMARILNQARELWGNARDIDRIILAGGGAIMARGHIINDYPHIMTIPDPDWANARGFYRRGLRLWNLSNKNGAAPSTM